MTSRKLMLAALALATTAIWGTCLIMAIDVARHRVWQPDPAYVLPTTYTPSPVPDHGTIRSPTTVPPVTPTCTRVLAMLPDHTEPPTLAEFWDGQAHFVVEVAETGLPMGESDTLLMPNGEVWSYVHASARSAGALDRCGDTVEFPGCVVIYRSTDGGGAFHHDQPPVCIFECQSCPCQSQIDHIDQQQYPRLFRVEDMLLMVYEYRARVFLRRSADGLAWTKPTELPSSGIWRTATGACASAAAIGPHPYLDHDYDCLAGGPPGLVVDGQHLYVFVGLGQNPGAMGCFYGKVNAPLAQLRPCRHNPLIVGAESYGPLNDTGAATNPFFDFRTISAAEVMRVGDRYYMLYEGIRGPGPGDPGDTQFGLGLARSLTGQIDDRWETYPHNPLLVDLPGNIGLGHADLLRIDGQTILFTSLDGQTRSRLRLVWK